MDKIVVYKYYHSEGRGVKKGENEGWKIPGREYKNNILVGYYVYFQWESTFRSPYKFSLS